MPTGREMDVKDSERTVFLEAVQDKSHNPLLQMQSDQQGLLVAEVFSHVGGGELQKDSEHQGAPFCSPVKEEEEVEDEEEDDDPSGANRRRARSLPADLFQDLKHASCCRKRVQFADMVGLDLASVKHFSYSEDPCVPSDVFSRLQRSCSVEFDNLDHLCEKFASCLNAQCWTPDFAQPGDANSFLKRVQDNKVCLERVTSSTCGEIRGVVRVLDFSSEKMVTVRYTFNNWATFLDSPAVYVVPRPQEVVATSADGGMDQFAFFLALPPFLEKGSSVCFAVCYKSDSGEYWDNNMGQNYIMRY
ncbi:protein phosphatase 1 regulatory subunit 3G [Protopterus annectens]|uniref:protein phosphatase 1 regulatory subunit 3G n=1 Tax=Protopterus annectens TaxID=7888 RepID=UPI001CFAA111|nr:protein phosphatase 1 regulatory subunit 3G [Protopterus annectens]